MLPRTETHARLFSQLADTVRSQEGSAQVFVVSEAEPAERDALINRFQADRGREYEEFEDRSGAFLKEVGRETKRRKFTFAELEEIEEDFEKLKTWLDKIRARDFFPNEGSQRAKDTLERCNGALKTFAEAVYAYEGVGAAGENSAKPKAAS